MSVFTLIALALLALTVFWAVGAYNRLVRLNNAVAAASAPLQAQLGQRHQVMADWMQAAGGYLGQIGAPLVEARAALDQARSASGAARGPLGAAKAATAVSGRDALPALLEAELALRARWDELQLFGRAHPELQADAELQALRQTLERSQHSLNLAVQSVNQAVGTYNSAQAQFPALLIAQMFRFTPVALWPDFEGEKPL